MPEENESLKPQNSKVSHLLLKLAGILVALGVLAGAATTFVGALHPLREEIYELISSSNEHRNPLVANDSEEIDRIEVAPIVRNWETVLDISRIAEGYQIDVNKYASVDQSNYKIQVKLDNLTDNDASFLITGEDAFLVSSTLSVGEVFDFNYNKEELRLKVVSIRKPAWYRKKAMYFKIERFK